MADHQARLFASAPCIAKKKKKNIDSNMLVCNLKVWACYSVSFFLFAIGLTVHIYIIATLHTDSHYHTNTHLYKYSWPALCSRSLTYACGLSAITLSLIYLMGTFFRKWQNKKILTLKNNYISRINLASGANVTGGFTPW